MKDPKRKRRASDEPFGSLLNKFSQRHVPLTDVIKRLSFIIDSLVKKDFSVRIQGNPWDWMLESDKLKFQYFALATNSDSSSSTNCIEKLTVRRYKVILN